MPPSSSVPTSIPSRSPRTPLQLTLNVATVVVAIYSRLSLIVPFVLSWALWGWIQRSDRAERRWVAWALALPAAHLLWNMFQVFVLQGTTEWAFPLASAFLLSLPLVWLYLRPSKAALWVQAAVSAALLLLAIRMIAHSARPDFQEALVRALVAAVYFYGGSLGAALLALFRSRPEAPPPGTGGEPVSALPTV